jgi:hypothetical protein
MLSRVSSAISVRTRATRSSGSAPAGACAPRLVRGAEPVGRLERLVEDALQLRRACGDQPLRLLEALGLAERRDGRLDLGLCVRTAVGHQSAS